MANVKNIDEIINLIKKDLVPSNWYNILRMFINSSEFENIIKFLINEVLINHRFTPPLRKILTPFYKCDYNNLKVIFIAKEPSGIISFNDGMAFSQPVATIKEKEIRSIQNAINKTVYNSKKTVSDFNSDLSIWAEQGVLLLNSSFTTVINKKGYHSEIWKSFITHMIDMLNSKNKNLVYVLFGKEAEFFEDVIDSENNLILKVSIPTNYNWDNKDIFNKINNYLKNHKKFLINW